MTEIQDPEFESEEELLYPDSDSELKKPIKKRNTIPYKSKMRNLKQYSKLTDAEFDALFTRKILGEEPDRHWEERIQEKLRELANDYDLDDLKINDKYVLRALVAAIIHLEDYDRVVGKIKSDGVDDRSMFLLTSVSKIQTDLRASISKMQEDLKMSRKSRRSEKEEDAVTFIEDLKSKAKKFYEQRMMYIFCPKCGTLLSTMWFLYPQFKTNIAKLKCHRDLGDGIICDGEVTITSEWLLNHGMRNMQDVPDSIK